MNNAEVNLINNDNPMNQVVQLGSKLRMALDQRNVRDQQYIRYVDKAQDNEDGDGLSRETAFKSITEGIAEMNRLSGKGATLLISPGFYVEASGVELTADDCLIKAIGVPEDTVWFGGTDAGAVGAATDHLLTISGGNNIIEGLGLFVYKNDKACVVFDDTGGGYHGSFNIIRGCYFSPQAQDGVGYGILYSGGNVNIIEGNIFYGAKESAIKMDSNEGNPVRNIIRDNQFVGTNIGVHIVCANYNTLIKDNWFSAGSQTSENMTNAITLSAGMTAGKVTAAGNYFEQSAAADISDSSGGGSVIEMNNFNGA